MDVHLVLKKDPLSEISPNFLRSDQNKIVFSKFQTQFNFKTVSYPEENVFERVANPLIERKFFEDKDTLLLTLGPTNSGKSHLLFQNENSIVNESLKTIFNRSTQFSGDFETIKRHYPEVIDYRSPNENSDISSDSFNYFSISMFELYNDSVIDLLNTDSKSEKAIYDIITDSVDYKLTPKNISKCLVNSYESAHTLIYAGYNKRKTCPTFANNYSSRSHCFIFLNIHKVYADVLKTTRFTIVDLAGLERSKSSRTSGRSLREAGHTNGSLTELGRCLELISMNQFHRTCLRTNKLTRLVLNDFVKNSNPVSILVTLDPFGELGLILQTLRYIDPIKHQVLQRRSLLASKNKSNMLLNVPDPALTTEIDKLRNSQKALKTKIQTLEGCIIDTEDRIRKELYNENEKKTTNLTIEHKEEIQRLKEKHVAQTDQKLQDQANSFNQLLLSLKAELNSKSEKLELAESNLAQIEKDFQLLTTEHSSLNSSLNNAESSFFAKYSALEKKFEEVNVQNESLKVEIQALQLTVADSETSHGEAILSLKETHQKAVHKIEIELGESDEKIHQLEAEIALKSEELCRKNVQVNELQKLYEKSQKSICDLEEGLKNELLTRKAVEDELTLTKEKLQGEINNKMTELSQVNSRYDENLEIMKTHITSMETELKEREIALSSLKKDYPDKFNALTEELNEVSSEKLQLQEELNQLRIRLDTEINALNGVIVLKDSELNLLHNSHRDIFDENQKIITNLKTKNENLQEIHDIDLKKIGVLEDTINKKQKELINAESNLTSLEQSANTITNELKAKLDKTENALIKEIKRAEELTKQIQYSNESGLKSLTTESEVNTLKLVENELKMSLSLKEKKLKDLLESNSKANDKLTKLQEVCDSLRIEVSQNQKLTEKYISLKSKSTAITTKIVSVEEENKKLGSILKSKEQELLEASEKIKKMASRLETFEKHQLKSDLSADPFSVVLRQSSTSSPTAIKASGKIVSVLDTDPLDDIGLPSMMSSPLKPPSFKIHSDSVEKDNTVTLPVSLKKKKTSAKKISKKDHLEKQKELHEKKMMESIDTPKVDRKKFKPLTNSRMSDLNKQNSLSESPKLNTKLKRRKSSSPLKPGKKKIRRSLEPNNSLEFLD